MYFEVFQSNPLYILTRLWAPPLCSKPRLPCCFTSINSSETLLLLLVPTMSKEEFFKVPKLLADGSNWVTYKDRLRWALNARSILNHLDKVIPELEVLIATELSPANDSAAADPSGGTKVLPKDFNTSMTELVAQSSKMRHDKWHTNEATVKQCIVSSVPDSVFNWVKMKDTAKDVWDAIAQIFEGRSLMVAINLRQKMQNVSCEASDDVRTHFDKLAVIRVGLVYT